MIRADVSDSLESLCRLAFSETCDPRAYVPRAATEAVLARIRAWGESDDVGSSVAALVGTPGIGKTQLLRVTESRINAGADLFVAEGGQLGGRVSNARALYLPYAGLSMPDLVFWVQGLLGISPDSSVDLDDPREALAVLLGLGGGPFDPFFLIFDDSDSMPVETVQTLIEALPVRESPLRIIVTLNPDSKASRLLAALDPLSPTEISFRTRMNAEETGLYVRERMSRSGFPGSEIARVDDAEADRIHSLSAGIPRRVHDLAAAFFLAGDEQRPSVLGEKERRESWMGRPIEDDLEV